MAKCILVLSKEVANTHYESCLLDACFSKGLSICDSIIAMTDVCSEAGVRMDCDFWQSIKGCGENV
jgi:hypothetical protein